MYNKQESTREQHNPGSTLCYAIARVTLDKIYKHVTGLTAHMWRLLLTVRFGPYFNSINYEPTFGFLEAHLNRCRNSPTQSPTILHLQVYNGNDDKRLCHLFCNVNVCKQCFVISDSKPLPTPLMVTSTLPTMFLEIIFNCLCCPWFLASKSFSAQQLLQNLRWHMYEVKLLKYRNFWFYYWVWTEITIVKGKKIYLEIRMMHKPRLGWVSRTNTRCCFPM